MTTRRLVLLFVACCGVATILTTPISVIAAAARLERFGVTVDRIQGSLRNIQLAGVFWRGQRVGDITLTPSWSDLWRLRLTMAATIDDGPISGQGRLSWDPFIGLALTNTIVAADLRALPSLLALTGRIDADIAHLTFGPQGCVKASLHLKTDALMRGISGLSWSGPALEGQGRCENRALVLPLSGRDGREALSTQMTMRPDYTFDVRILIENPDAAISQLLPAIGFQPEGEAWMLIQTGRWG